MSHLCPCLNPPPLPARAQPKHRWLDPWLRRRNDCWCHRHRCFWRCWGGRGLGLWFRLQGNRWFKQRSRWWNMVKPHLHLKGHLWSAYTETNPRFDSRIIDRRIWKSYTVHQRLDTPTGCDFDGWFVVRNLRCQSFEPSNNFLTQWIQLVIHEFWDRSIYDFCMLLPCEDSGKVQLVLKESWAQHIQQSGSSYSTLQWLWRGIDIS